MEVAYEGGANILYRMENGQLLRVSKHGKRPREILSEWNMWRNTTIGMYIPELSINGDGVVLDELSPLVASFKPKWLLQSPDAPSDALQCRTCAIRSLRGQPQFGCPLDLCDPETLPFVLESMGCGPPTYEVIVKSQIIAKIQSLQSRLECSAFEEPISPNLLKCMCLRDCTILIESSGRIALVDLDSKEEGKVRKWRELEQNLQSIYKNPNPVCRISRNRSLTVIGIKEEESK